MGTIGIIGSGNTGANTAFFLAEKAVANVILYDLQEGVSEGKALDMMEAASIRAYQTGISGTNNLADILGSEVIIIAAGSPRKPGMQREDLYDDNRSVIADMAAALTGYKGIVIVVTEPVDILTTEFIRKSGLPPGKVMGLGGSLDSARLRYLIADELSISYENVSAMVIGRHSKDMIPLSAYCRVSGLPVQTLMSEKRLNELFDEMRKSGDMIVDLAQRSSAYYGPAAVASDLAEAIIRNTRRIISVSQMYSGQYGIENVAMSLPAVIGTNGIEKTLTPILDDSQKRLITASGDAIRSVVG
jgi:malate dehydrogenase